MGKIIKERGKGVICAEQIQAYRSKPAGHLPLLHLSWVINNQRLLLFPGSVCRTW